MGKEKITRLKERNGENGNPWGGQGAEAAWARLWTPAGSKGEAGSDEVRAASASSVLHICMECLKTTKCFSKAVLIQCWRLPGRGPLPDPWVRREPKVAGMGNPTLRDVSKKRMCRLVHQG